jgi:hypothetical protein
MHEQQSIWYLCAVIIGNRYRSGRSKYLWYVCSLPSQYSRYVIAWSRWEFSLASVGNKWYQLYLQSSCLCNESPSACEHNLTIVNCPLLYQKRYRVEKLTIRECRRSAMELKNWYNPPSVISEISITELDRNFKFWYTICTSISMNSQLGGCICLVIHLHVSSVWSFTCACHLRKY